MAVAISLRGRREVELKGVGLVQNMNTAAPKFKIPALEAAVPPHSGVEISESDQRMLKWANTNHARQYRGGIESEIECTGTVKKWCFLKVLIKRCSQPHGS